MILKSLTVRRQGDYYGSYRKVKASAPFEATIEVQGERGEVKLNLSADLSRRIVEIVADEAASAGRETAKMMTADAMDVKALPKATA